MKLGFIIGSHVVYQTALVRLLNSMIQLNGIDPSSIVVSVNGCAQEDRHTEHGGLFLFRAAAAEFHFIPIVQYALGEHMGITHWLFLNSTGECGQRFKQLVMEGFDPEADATVAQWLMGDNLAVNDCAVYRDDYLMSRKSYIENFTNFGVDSNEGRLYSTAPRKSSYPIIERVVTGPTDVYGTGTPRITEHYPGIDFYRYKKNWGQLPLGSYKLAQL